MTCPHCGAETPAALSRCLSCSKTLPATSAPARPQDSSEDGALTAYPPARGSGGQAGDAVTDAETGTLPPGFADRSAADDNDALTTGLQPARATSPRSSPPPQTGLSASGRNLTSSGGTDRVIPPHIAEGLTGGFGDEATGAGHGSTPAAHGPARDRTGVRPPLPHHPAARRRRHGRGLPGVGRRARRRRRAQGRSARRSRRIRQAARELERRFKRELLLARQVTHKNVVRIHDLGEIDGIKYITMPYIEGDDLGDRPQARRQAAGRRACCASRATIVAGLSGRARGRRRPPRSQARQHHDRRRRRGDDHGLRHRPVVRRTRETVAPPTGGAASAAAAAACDRAARRWRARSSAPSQYMAPEQAHGEPSISAPTSTRSA